MEHTPGPWKLEYDNDANGSYSEWYNLLGSNDYCIAQIGRSKELSDIDRKNAQILKAALDLLKALEEIAHYKGTNGYLTANEAVVFVRIAEHAIAKIKE